jgi:hypothetical protein
MELLATGVKLQFQIVLRAAFTARVAHLQQQGAVEGIRGLLRRLGSALPEAHSMQERLAAEIGSASHQLTELPRRPGLRDRHG